MILALAHARGDNQLQPNFPEQDETTPNAWEEFVRHELIPSVWDSTEAALEAFETEYQKWFAILAESDGVAEERAVTAALVKGGPMDDISTLRARVQREGDRDRANYVKLQQRTLADHGEGEAGLDTGTD